MLRQLAALPEAAVISRVGALLEHWAPGSVGAHDLVEAWLAAAGAVEAEAILDAVDRGAAIGSFDQAWSAQYLQDAGAHGPATELAELALRGWHWDREATRGLRRFCSGPTEPWRCRDWPHWQSNIRRRSCSQVSWMPLMTPIPTSSGPGRASPDS